MHALAGLGGLLGLALSFAHLLLNRPLSYLEAFALLVVGYRLLEWGLKPEWRPVVAIPGLVALALLAVSTGSWSDHVLIWGVAWLVELAFQQVRHAGGGALGTSSQWVDCSPEPSCVTGPPWPETMGQR